MPVSDLLVEFSITVRVDLPVVGRPDLFLLLVRPIFRCLACEILLEPLYHLVVPPHTCLVTPQLTQFGLIIQHPGLHRVVGSRYTLIQMCANSLCTLRRIKDNTFTLIVLLLLFVQYVYASHRSGHLGLKGKVVRLLLVEYRLCIVEVLLFVLVFLP